MPKKFNENFDLILNGCSNRKDTWINSTLSNTYKLLDYYAYSKISMMFLMIISKAIDVVSAIIDANLV